MAIVNTAEGGTNGVTVDTSNSGGASGDACTTVTSTSTFSTSAAYKGTLGYDFTLAAATAGMQIWSLSASTRTVMRFYMKMPTLLSTLDYIATIRSTSANMGTIILTSANKFAAQNATGTTISGSTATNAISANTWYRVELAVTKGTTTSNGRIEYAYYIGDSTTAEFTFDSGAVVNAGTANIGSVRLGRNTAGSTIAATFYYDDIAGDAVASGSWLGPSPLAYSTSVSLSGSGSMTSAVTPGFTQTGSLSGSGTQTAAQTAMTANPAGTLSGSGTLTAPQTNAIASTSVSLSGSGALSSTRTLAITDAVSLSGSGSLTRSVTSVTLQSTVSLTGSGTLSSTVVPSFSKSLGLSGSGTLTTSSTPGFSPSVALSGSGTLVGVPTNSPTASIALSGSGALTASVVPSITASAALSGSGTLTKAVTPRANASVNLSGSGALAATLTSVTFTTTKAFGGSGTLVAIGEPRITVTKNLSSTGTLSFSNLVAESHMYFNASGVGTLVGLTTRVTASAGRILSGSGTLLVAPYEPQNISVVGYLADKRWHGGLGPQRWEGSL